MLQGTIVQGVALGAGSAIGRKAVDSVFDAFSSSGSSAPPVAQQQQQAPKFNSGPCESDHSAFIQCMQQNKGSAGSCDSYFSALQQCQMNNNV